MKSGENIQLQSAGFDSHLRLIDHLVYYTRT